MRTKKDQQLTLAQNLKSLKAAGTNFSQIARKAEIPVSTLSAWSGLQIPTDHSALLRLAKVIGVDLETLLFGDVNKKIEPLTIIGKEIFEGRFQIDVRIKRIPDDK